jgi:hypothetical protein
MADGFQVDLGALEDAAAGINTTLNQLRSAKVDQLDGDKAMYGHDQLAETIADFCDRWEIGVEHLATDGQQVALRLSQCVQAYLQSDRAAKGRMDGIYGLPDSPDPAAD